MSQRDRAGLVIQIVTAGTLADVAALIAIYGPCDALKADADVTVDGTPADALTETVSGFIVSGGQWDPTGWQAITDINGSGSFNVWAGWYSRRVAQ